MLGGPSVLSHKRSYDNRGRLSTCSQAAKHHVTSHQGQEENTVTGTMAAVSEPVWLQNLLHHIKAMETNGRKMLATMMQHGVQPLSRRPAEAPSMANQHRLRQDGSLFFASISNTLKSDHPKQAQKMEELKDSAEQLAEDMRIPVPETTVPGIGDVRSLALKQLLCGILAGAVASFCITPFNVLRTRVIAGRGGSSAAEVMGTVMHVEGMQSLMKGSLKFTVIANSIQKGIQFSVYEAVKRTEQQQLGKDPKWLPAVPRKVEVSTVAGAAAGLAATLIMYPLNTLMDRMLLQPSQYSSVFGSAAKVVKENGFSELYRGIIPALLTLVPQAAASFYTYETVKKKLGERRGKDFLGLSTLSIGAGAAAGIVAASLTYPLEVARKQISMSALPQGTVGVGGAMAYNSLPQALAGIAQREGLGGFYRGFVVEALQIVPMTAISFAIYEAAKRALVAEREERRDEVKG